MGVDDKRSHNGGLIPESQSRQFGEKEVTLGSFTTSDTLEKSDFILPFPVSSSTVSSPMVVSDPTSRLSLPVASDIKSSVLDTNGNSVSSPTVEGDGNEESSLTASEQGTAKQEFTRELHRKEQLKGASLKRQPGMHTLLILLYTLMSHSNNVLNGVYIVVHLCPGLQPIRCMLICDKCHNQAGPSSILSSMISNLSDSLVLNIAD